MNPEPIIIFAAVFLYIGLGIMYTQMLNAHWVWYYRTAKQHPALHGLAVTTWPIFFIVFITWRTFEPLTSSRKKDWNEL